MTNTPSDDEKKETALNEIIEGLQKREEEDSFPEAISQGEDAPDMPVHEASDESVKSKKLLKAGMLLNQYVLSAMVLFFIVGAISFFLFLQKDWIKVKGNKMVSRLVEKKLEESLDKYMDLNDNLRGGKRAKAKLSDDIKGENSSGVQRGREETQEDRTEYIIEANRLYEQGDYKTAASLYGKGLDKSMPFLNEDFIVYRLGDCYFQSGDYKEALEVFRHLNNDYLNSEYQLQSRLKMGECCAKLGDYKQARKTHYSVIAQEGDCKTEEDKSCVAESYFKIGDYYREESKRLKNASQMVGTVTAGSGKSNDHL
jgi:tetratricopeptide (TPR) repeat protein